MLEDVKKALGITGSYQDETLQIYIDEVIAFLSDAGVSESNITIGIVARGVSDLWNYGSGEGKLSQYFVQRAIQLSKQGGKQSGSGGGGGSPDLSKYYTKVQTDALLLLKANVSDVYDKGEVDNALLGKADVENVYSKSEVDTALSGKADTDDLANKQDKTDNTLETTAKQIPNAINEVNQIAKGAQKGISYGDYETMITAFNALASSVYNVGQSVYIISLDVPDLWVSDIESGSVPYTYTTDEAFVSALQTDGYVQVGFYKLSALETGKVDLSDYYTQTQTDNLLAPKLTEPASNLAVGKYFRIASIDADGHAVLECVDAPTAPVQGVSAAGTTLTPDANGIVNIPIATQNNPGIVKVTSSNGIGIYDGYLLISFAPPDSNFRRYNYQPVTPYCIDYAVKAAMTDGRGAAWTDAERLAALARMGCTVDANGFVKFTAQN